MFWAKLYLASFLLMSIAGFLFDARNNRTPAETAINVIGVAAPALLVLAHIVPGALHYKASLLALMAITVISNWVSGRMYLREMNAAEPEEVELNNASMVIGVLVVLSPALWFGVQAYMRG